MRVGAACLAVLLCVFSPLPAVATAQGIVPPVVRFGGTLPVPEGTALATFHLYAEASGGEALWSETQAVIVDPGGHYTVLLGATRADGLPRELFSSGAARWVGVAAGGQDELPRVPLTSAAYALKAADAETVAGRPLSAFVLAGDWTGVGDDGLMYLDKKLVPQALGGSFAPAPTANAGTANYLGMFTNATDLGNSVIYQSGTNVGINTTSPVAPFHSAATAAPGAFFDVYNDALSALPMVNRAARGTASAPTAVQANDILGGLAVRGYGATTFGPGVGQVMFRAAETFSDTARGTYLQMTTTPVGSGTWLERLRIDPAGNVGIGTTTPAQRLSVAGVVESTSGGFKFPDGTTQTTAGGASYSAGAGLSLASHVFSVNFAGTGSAAAVARSDHNHSTAYVSLGGSYSDPTWLASVGAGKISGSLPVSQVAGAASLTGNIFTGTQSISTGNLGLPSTTGASSGVLTLNGQAFLHSFGATTNQNTFVGPLAGGGFATSGAGGENAFGYRALHGNTTGAYNNAFGSQASEANSTGSYNSAFGHRALAANVIGNSNAAFGALALSTSTEGTGNSAFGAGALQNANYMSGNSAFGHLSLQANTQGGGNSAFGESSLWKNTIGYNNTALGQYSAYANTEGNRNTAVGEESLRANTIGSDNIAIGYYSLYHNVDGGGNVGIGTNSLSGVVSGSRNVAVGAGGANVVNGTDNTFIGYGATALVDVTNATAIGAYAQVQASNALVLGGAGVNVGIGTPAPIDRLQVLGDIRVGLNGTPGCVKAYGGDPIAGTCSSDARLKDNIQPYGPVLDRVARLRPVHYTWRDADFPSYHFGPGTQSGLVAQEVEQVFPEIVGIDEHGYKTVSYSQLPLLAVAAVRELKAEDDRLAVGSERLRAENELLKTQLAALAERVRQLEERGTAPNK